MSRNRFSSGSNYRTLSLLAVIGLLLMLPTTVSAHVGEHSTEGSEERPEWDFGDAPDLPYPSRLFSNGARHRNVSQAWMGEGVDREKDSRQVDRDGFEQGLVGVEPVEIKVVNKRRDGDLYLNLLADRDLSGEWEKDEWVLKNRRVELAPGEKKTVELEGVDVLGEENEGQEIRGIEEDVLSVVRLTLTGEKISSYRGKGEFEIGETEDYLLEEGLKEDPCLESYPGGTGMNVEPENSGLGWGHGREVDVGYRCEGEGCKEGLLEDAEVIGANKSSDVVFDREDPGKVSSKEHNREERGEVEVKYRVRSQPITVDGEEKYCSSGTFEWKGYFYHNGSLVPPEMAEELREKDPQLLDDLYTGLRGYNNATREGEVPPSAKKFLFSKMVGKMEHRGGETLVKIRLEPGKSLQMKEVEKIERDELEAFNPGVIVEIDSRTFSNMVKSSQPYKTFRKSWKKGSINIEGQGIFNGAKYGFLEFIGRMASRINDVFTESLFEVGEGKEKYIEAGETVLKIRKNQLGHTTAEAVKKPLEGSKDILEPEDGIKVEDLVSRIKTECRNHPVTRKCVGVIDEEGALYGVTVNSSYKLLKEEMGELSKDAGIYSYPEISGREYPTRGDKR